MNEPIIPSEALEGLLRKALVEETIPAGLFWDALLKSHLYVPVSAQKEEEERPTVSDGQEEIPMLLGEDSEGRRVAWVFTSSKALLDYTERDLPFRSVAATTLFEVLSETPYDVVLIGPHSVTLGLHRDLVQSLAEGKVPDAPDQELHTVPKDAPVEVGRPSEPTDALEGRFAALFADMPEVEEASFIQVADPTGSRLLLGLRLSEESTDRLRAVTEQVAKAAEGVLDKGQRMDVTFINRSLKEAFQKWGRTFFKR